MKEWIENQIEETYQSMLQAIKNDDLDNASKLQQIIDDLKKQLDNV